MSDEREYDTYCAYKNTMVAKSEYNQSGTFEHICQNGVGVVIGSKIPCRCVDCAQTDHSKCEDCDWLKQLEQEFAKSLSNRCTGCMAQYKKNGYLR